MAGLEDREVVVLLLGMIVGGFAFTFRKKLTSLPLARWPVMAATFLLVGWVLSTLETWIAPTLLNILEHAAYVAHSMLMLVWIFAVWSKSRSQSSEASR